MASVLHVFQKILYIHISFGFVLASSPEVRLSGKVHLVCFSYSTLIEATIERGTGKKDLPAC